jgi:nitronate monooxygenase
MGSPAVHIGAAVSAAGRLIGGGYGDLTWLSEQFDVDAGRPVGAGFIT